MPRKKPPELTFQQHLADFLIREHGYGVLEQGEITDTEHCIAEDHIWAFLQDTQPETLKKLANDYGKDARDEVFRALRAELQRQTPLWLLLRDKLKVRGLEFHLYYPKPRSSESVASTLYDKNRITFRPHFYFGDKNQEIDFVLFLNGLPIVALELKHEKNQNVHDAVAQFTARDHACKIFQHPFLYLAADTSDVMAATNPRPVVPKPDEKKLYPAGVVAKALKNVAFQDDGLIQYKAEVMLRIFEENVKPLVAGRAKAMIVATSRVAGLRYFEVIKSCNRVALSRICRRRSAWAAKLWKRRTRRPSYRAWVSLSRNVRIKEANLSDARCYVNRNRETTSSVFPSFLLTFEKQER